jgi:hypothetical protein
VSSTCKTRLASAQEFKGCASESRANPADRNSTVVLGSSQYPRSVVIVTSGGGRKILCLSATFRIPPCELEPAAYHPSCGTGSLASVDPQGTEPWARPPNRRTARQAHPRAAVEFVWGAVGWSSEDGEASR